jgi:hypothetical protein
MSDSYIDREEWHRELATANCTCRIHTAVKNSRIQLCGEHHADADISIGVLRRLG